MSTEQSRRYTPEEMVEIEKSRTISDSELLKSGAGYKINEEGEKGLEVTGEQIEEVKNNYKKEVEEALLKSYTERALSDAELIKGGIALGEIPGERFEGKVNEGARYVIDKISGRAILEVGEQQRLEMSGRGETVQDAVQRLEAIFKEQGLKRGDEVKIYLKDNSTRIGYYDDGGSSSAIDWIDDNQKAYFGLGGWINQGEFSFGIRGHQYVPVQAIERVETIWKSRDKKRVR